MDNNNLYHYDIFETEWGWFGVLARNKKIIRTYLPGAKKESVQRRLLDGFQGVKRDTEALSGLKQSILTYYEGRPVDFSDVTVHFEDFTEFQQKVLTTLRIVSYGKTVTYGDLARLSGNPNAARAVGTVLANNPMPLIIPCHRVIKSDGTCGRFSAPGGAAAKKRMLELEKQE